MHGTPQHEASTRRQADARGSAGRQSGRDTIDVVLFNFNGLYEARLEMERSPLLPGVVRWRDRFFVYHRRESSDSFYYLEAVVQVLP